MPEGFDRLDEMMEQRVSGGSGGKAFKFALESPKGAVRQTGRGGNADPVSAPRSQIQETRAQVRGDPHLARSLELLTDYVVGDSFNIAPLNVPGVDDVQLTIDDIGEVKRFVETSNFHTVLWDAVWHAWQDGVSFIEINWEDGEVFKPKLLPGEDMAIIYDEFGRIVGYELDSGQGQPVEYGKYEVAHLGFYKHPNDDWFWPLARRAIDQSNMLRDMEIDQARFIATKAYPPILWKVGDETDWSPQEMERWIDSVQNIQPDTMLVGPGDVDVDVVGVNEQSGSGAMDLGETFNHLEKRIATGIGLPYVLINGAQNGREAVTQMPAFDRYVKRLRARVKDMVENQILRSLMYHPNPEESEAEPVPVFEFGNHSSEEDRLEVKTALQLFTHGFLTREAFAERIGIDPEVEMPTTEQFMGEILPVLEVLPGAGGGRPVENGAEDKTATERQNPEEDTSGDDQRRQTPVEDEGPR